MSQTDTIYVKMASKMDFRAKISIIYVRYSLWNSGHKKEGVSRWDA